MDDLYENYFSFDQMAIYIWYDPLSIESNGEFGAVSVISGHLRGLTNTLPLHVEILFNEFNTTEAFAVASILVMLSIALLILRLVLQYVSKRKISRMQKATA